MLFFIFLVFYSLLQYVKGIFAWYCVLTVRINHLKKKKVPKNWVYLNLFLDLSEGISMSVNRLFVKENSLIYNKLIETWKHTLLLWSGTHATVYTPRDGNHKELKSKASL
jgi:hypothetical protein